MECDRTGVYETYYIPKDQTDKILLYENRLC